MSSLAQMVIRLVAEARQFKADLSDAAQHTQKVAADITQSTGKVQQAAAALGDQLGVQRGMSEQAGAAVAQMGAAHSLATVAVGSLAAGVAAYALVMYKASQETQRQADALTLTGNAAGLVSGQLNQMARESASFVNGQVGNMRQVMEGLVATGRVTQTSLAEMAQGVALVSQFSGQSRDAVTKDFATMASGVADWAAKHNEQYHYLTLDQYKYIESLEKAGDKQRAMAVNADLLAKTLGGDLTKNLGTLQKAWAGVQAWASRAWDAMLNVGREETATEKLAAVQKQLDYLATQKTPKQGSEKAAALKAALQERAAGLQEEIKLERRAADEKEALAAKSEAAIKKYRDDQKTKGAKGDPNRAIDEEIAALKAGEAAKAEIVKQGLDTIQSERKRGVISEGDALQQTVALQLQALADKRTTVEAELELSKKKTNSGKEQAALQGQIAALEAQQRTVAIKYGNDYFEMVAKGNLAAADAHLKYIHTLEQGLAKMQLEVDKQNEHNERLGLSKQAIAALDAEKLNSQAVTLELMAIKQLDKNLDEVQYRLYKDQAKALRDLAAAKVNGASKEASIAAEKEIAEEGKRTAETIGRSLTDSLMRGFEAGKSFARNLRDTTAAMFKTLVLRPIIQAGVGAVFGLSGMQAGAGQSSGSGMGGLINTGRSLYNGLTGPGNWFSDFSGSATNAASKIGGQIGGDFGQSIISNAPEIGAGLETVGEGLGYLNAALAASKGEWGKALGSAVGTYFGGPVGAAIGSAVGSWIDSAAGGGTRPSIEGGFASSGTQGSANGKAYVNGVYGGALDANAKTLVTDIASAYASTVALIGRKAGTLTGQAFIGMDGNNGAKGSQNALSLDAQLNGKWLYNRWTDNGGSLGAGTTDKEMAAAADLSGKKILIEALKATDLGESLNAYLSAVTVQGKELAALSAILADVTNVGALHAALKGLPFEALTAMSVEATKALAEATGGFDALKNKLGSYLQNFYSDSERAALTTKQVGAELGALGMVMPVTREGFRALVEAQDLTTEAGRASYAALLNVADAFAAVVPVTEAAAAAVSEAADLEAERTRALSDAKGALEKSTGAERERIQGLIDADQVAVDRLRGVFDLLATSAAELYGQVDAAAAMSAANGRAYISTALALMNAGGVVPDQAGLQSAIAAARAGVADTRYASKFEADRARLQLAGELSQLKDKTGEQLSTAERQLAVDKAQLTALEQMVAGLDGLKEPVLAIADAVAAWVALQTPKVSSASGATAAVFGGTATFGGGGGGSTATDQSPYVFDPADFGGLSAEEYQRRLKGLIPGFANGGDFAGGLAMVGERGPELVAMGPARVFTAQDTARILTGDAGGGAGAGGAMDLAELRDESKRLALANLNLQRQMIKLLEVLDDWDHKGMPPVRATGVTS